MEIYTIYFLKISFTSFSSTSPSQAFCGCRQMLGAVLQLSVHSIQVSSTSCFRPCSFIRRLKLLFSSLLYLPHFLPSQMNITFSGASIFFIGARICYDKNKLYRKDAQRRRKVSQRKKVQEKRKKYELQDIKLCVPLCSFAHLCGIYALRF